MQNTRCKGLFSTSSTTNLSSTDWRAAQPSTFVSSHLVLLLAQLFGGKDKCIFLITGFTLNSFHIARSHFWIFSYDFLVMFFHSFHKNRYEFPKVFLFFFFLNLSRGCRWQLLIKECGWQLGKRLNSCLYLGLQEKPASVSPPTTEKAITNLMFWGCSNKWPQSIDVWPSGVSPVTSDSPREFSPGTSLPMSA